MYLFELFDLGETVTYAIIAAVVVLFALFVLLVVKVSKKEKEAKSGTTVSKKQKKAEKVDEDKLASLKIVDKNSTVVETKPVVVEEQQVEETVVEEQQVEETVVEEQQVEETVVEEQQVEETVVEEEPKVEEKATSNRYKGKYVVFQEGDFFRYRLKASNGEALILSEPYTSEKGARAGIETLKRNVGEAKIDVVEDKHGLFHFRLITKANRILAQSANYEAQARAVSASKSFEKFVMTDIVIFDETVSTTHTAAEKIEVEVSPDSSGKFIIEKVEDGYEYILKASNGRKICNSKAYKTLATCKTSLEGFRDLVYTGDFYIFKDKNGNFQFKLYNAQNRLVMTGEVYSTKKACLNVIESIKRFARFAELVE